MRRLVDWLLLRWLRRVAPDDWADSVLGDLYEDAAGVQDRSAGWRTRLDLARVAVRFSADRAATRWRDRRADRPRGGRLMSIAPDARHAIRSLRHSPGFVLAAVSTLALAIGANTAIYSALSQLVLHPLPFTDGDRLVYIWDQNAEMGGVMLTPPRRAVQQWRAATHVFDAVISHTSLSVVVTDGGEPEELSLSLVTPAPFEVLGVRPVVGRAVVEADLAAGAPPVVLIGHALWRSRFGGAADVVGRPMRLGDETYTIIGVMPARFALPMGSDVLWAAARTGAGVPGRDSENTIARLAPGVSVAQAQAALEAMAAVETDPDRKGWTGRIMPPAESNGTVVSTALYVLSGAVGLLLLIACVNVANLMVSRHSSRRRETAMRHALGASRGRLLRTHLLESAVIAGAGGLLGLGVAHAGIGAMAALRPRNLDVLERVHLDATALLFTALVVIATGLVFGLAPAVAASRVDLQDLLRAGGRAATPSGHRVRRALTVAQVALAMTLLVGSSLLLRSYARLSRVDPGYDPRGVLSLRVSLPSARYPSNDPARRHLFFEQARAAIAAVPGVETVAVGSGVPPDSGILFGELEIDGRPASEKRSTVFSGGFVTPEYFSTLRIPIVEGRGFTPEDTAGRDPVVIVGQTFAREFWPNASPVGARLRLRANAAWATVVGVAGDVKALGLAADSGRLQLYQPRAQVRPGFGTFVVRTARDPRPLIPAFKAAIWTQDPTLPLGDVATAHELVARSTSQSRFNMALLVGLAACGLALAIIGVYGVTAIYVGQREREVGIRMALGATRTAVARLVVRQTAIVLGVGLLIGLIGAAWLSRYVTTLLFQTSAADPVSFLAPAAAIVAATLVATLAPLRRATTVDPSIALRSD